MGWGAIALGRPRPHPEKHLLDSLHHNEKPVRVAGERAEAVVQIEILGLVEAGSGACGTGRRYPPDGNPAPARVVIRRMFSDLPRCAIWRVWIASFRRGSKRTGGTKRPPALHGLWGNRAA